MRFCLLGPLQGHVGDVPLDVGTRKQRLILASLLMARGRVVAVHQLLESAWDGEPPASSATTLQAYVSRIRQMLQQPVDGPPVELVRQPPGYRLDGVRLDVDDFERLSDEAAAHAEAGRWGEAAEAAGAALSLWRGPLLADLPDHPWVLDERRRFDERLGRCVEVRTVALLGLDRAAEAQEQAGRLRELQPLRDQPVWLHMLALHRCSRSVEALEVFREHVRLLDEELGLGPGQRLRDLQTGILREEPALQTWPRQPPADPDSVDTSADETPRIPRESPTVRLVGRTGLLDQAQRWLAEMRSGTPRWLLLTGAGGIGKTRLAEELAHGFQSDGVRVAWSSCVHDEGVPSWWQLRSLVRQLGGDPDELFHVPPDADADATRFAVYERMLDQLRAVALERPVLVVIDDVQWLDATSTRALSYLLQTMRGVPVGVVLVLRDGEGRAGVDSVVAAFASNTAVAAHLDVGPLDDAGVADLLAELAGRPVPITESLALARQTGGNPLLLTEYARLPAAERAGGAVPLAVRAVLSRRFESFDREARRILHMAALAGHELEPDLLAAAAGTSLDHVVDVLDVAAHESIIVPGRDGSEYQFSHPLLREHLLGELSTIRRQAIHAAIAKALALRGGSHEDLLRRAQHLSEAGPVAPLPTVLDACRQAASYAESQADWEVAARYWAAARTALGGRRRGGADADGYDDLLVAQVSALAHAGSGATLLEVVDEALESAGSRGGRTAVRLARVLLRSAGGWPWSSYGPVSSRILDRLRAGEMADEDARAQVPLAAARAVGHSGAAEPPLSDELSRQALVRGEELGDADVLADALLGRALTIAGGARRDGEVVELLDRLTRLPHRNAALDRVISDTLLTMVDFRRGDAAAAEEHLRLAAAGSDQHRLPAVRAQLRWIEATLAHWYGDLDRAEELARHARARHAETELHGSEELYLTASLALRWERGTLSSADADIQRSPYPLVWAAAAAAERGDARTGRSLVDLALHSSPAAAYDGSVPVTGRGLPGAGPSGGRADQPYALGGLSVLAHAAADLGLTGVAPRLLELLEPYAGSNASIGHAGPVGPVALPVGRLRALLEDVRTAERDYADAARMAEGAHAGPALVRVRAAQAELAPAGEQRDRALAAAAERARRAGLEGLARRLPTLPEDRS